MRLLPSLAAGMLAMAFTVAGLGCGSGSSNSSGDAALAPATVIRAKPGETGPQGPCNSWLGGGVAAAYCASRHEAPAPTGEESIGQIRFTGLKKSATSGGISQVVGTLPEGRTIGVEVHGETAGTLLAQGLCDGKKVKAAFYKQRFVDGARGTISIVEGDGVPVILLTLDDRTIAPDREVVWDLSWLPAEAKQTCAFALQ